MKCLRFFAIASMAFAMFAATQSAANELLNPGFEADAALDSPPVPVASSWITFGNTNTASASLDPVHTGIGSLQLAGGGNFGVPGAYQILPAIPGDVWDLQGYMLTQNTLPANATFGLLKIVWGNGVSDLAPGTITIGQAGPPANPGIEALAHLDSFSTPNTWQFTQARGVAPAGTTEVRMYALFVDQSAGTGYFDDLQATLIPAQLAVPGDYNSNKVVDAADYTVWQDTLGSTTDLRANGDNTGASAGMIDLADYAFWKTNFGLGGGSGAGGSGALPEPATLVMLFVGILVMCSRRRAAVP